LARAQGSPAPPTLDHPGAIGKTAPYARPSVRPAPDPEETRPLTYDPASVHDIPVEDGLLFGCLLDGRGGGRLCDWSTAEQWTEKDRPFWLHLDNESARAAAWLRTRSNIPPAVAETLLAKESRPRSMRIGSGLLTILRGVNFSPGAEPEDLVAIRMWVEANRIVTVRYERLVTPREVLADVLGGDCGLTDAPALFVALAERLTLKMNDVIIALEDDLAELEAQVDSDRPAELRSKLADLRYNCVALRRYISPQREALANLQIDAPAWLDDNQRMHIRETADRTTRYLEDLDAARDRAVVVLDELANKMAESMNRTMYALSIVAGIFLPLGFLTGLLGINVGGMPGVNDSHAFWITCGLIVVVLVVEIMVLRRLKWI